MITSKSLHHSNIAFIFDKTKIAAPDNSVFAGLYGGQAAQGARFLDDPLIQTKALTLPQIKIKVILEAGRLRVEDESQEEPAKSALIKETAHIWQKLFPGQHPAGFGFNFDIYFRFNNIIPIQDIFASFFKKSVLEKNDLRDLGVQFTLDRSGQNFTETWFLKVTAPLEIATHINRHFAANKLPAENALQTLFENCYNETDDIIGNFISS